MAQQTTTITEEVEKEKTVTETETFEEEVEVVVCDGCGCSIGAVEDVIPNYITYNPDVDIKSVTEQIVSKTEIELHNQNIIDEITIDNPNDEHNTFKQQEVTEEDFINALQTVLSEEQDELITFEVDDFDEVCDECGLDHGISLSTDRTKQQFEIRDTETETESETFEETKTDNEILTEYQKSTFDAFVIFSILTILIFGFPVIQTLTVGFLLKILSDVVIAQGIDEGAITG